MSIFEGVRRVNIITHSQAVKVNDTFKTIVEVRTEDISEITPPNSEWAVGSLAWDITTGKIYGLKQTGWVEQDT